MRNRQILFLSVGKEFFYSFEKNFRMKAIVKLLLRYLPRPLLIKISLLINKPLSFLYRGNKVACPVCGKTFRKFLPYGYTRTNKDNRLCPNCLSLERHRLLWMYLDRQTDYFNRRIEVLHIAPEQPFIKRFRKNSQWKYVTADLLSPIADVKTDIRDMKEFAEETFDLVICNHVLEHIDDEQKALAELKRILKSGGKAILQVPIDYSLEHTFEDDRITDKKERERIFGQYDHVRVYGRDYPERLQQAGFEVEENMYVKTFTESELERFRLDKEEVIYIVCKA
jgi:SAM-dependent methyltransferase